jgi:hypothetical protein
MDDVTHDRRWLALHALSGRIRELPKRITNRLSLAGPNPSVVRKLKALTFVSAAVIFGMIAHRLNGQENEIRWRKSHLPTAKIWSTSFLSEGFRSIENPSLKGHITRTLPSLTDSQGRIWSASPDWWAVETADITEPLLFCQVCALKPPPGVWKSVGTGWEGWETAMKQVHRQSALGLAQSRAAKHPVDLDPREIRY